MSLAYWLNTAWMLKCVGEARAFRRATRAVARTQAGLLAEMLRRNRDTDFGRVHGFARDWIKSDEGIATAMRWLRAYMEQHLRVRNEIWNYPLSPDRLAAIDRGDIAPFDPKVDL